MRSVYAVALARAVEAADYYDVRDSAGKFSKIADRIVSAIRAGVDDPFRDRAKPGAPPLTNTQLRNVGRAVGVTLRPGMSDVALKHEIMRLAPDHKLPEPKPAPAKKAAAKATKAAPRKAAAARDTLTAGQRRMLSGIVDRSPGHVVSSEPGFTRGADREALEARGLIASRPSVDRGKFVMRATPHGITTVREERSAAERKHLRSMGVTAKDEAEVVGPVRRAERKAADAKANPNAKKLPTLTGEKVSARALLAYEDADLDDVRTGIGHGPAQSRQARELYDEAASMLERGTPRLDVAEFLDDARASLHHREPGRGGDSLSREPELTPADFRDPRDGRDMSMDEAADAHAWDMSLLSTLASTLHKVDGAVDDRQEAQNKREHSRARAAKPPTVARPAKAAAPAAKPAKTAPAPVAAPSPSPAVAKVAAAKAADEAPAAPVKAPLTDLPDTSPSRARDLFARAKEREAVGDYRSAASLYGSAIDALDTSMGRRRPVNETHPEEFELLRARQAAARDRAKGTTSYTIVSWSDNLTPAAERMGAKPGDRFALSREGEDTPVAWFKARDEAQQALDAAYVAQMGGGKPAAKAAAPALSAPAAPATKAAPKRVTPPSPGTVHQQLLAMPASERKEYLAGLGLTQAQANTLAKGLGAQRTRISADATLDSIVAFFADAPEPMPVKASVAKVAAARAADPTVTGLRGLGLSDLTSLAVRTGVGVDRPRVRGKVGVYQAEVTAEELGNRPKTRDELIKDLARAAAADPDAAKVIEQQIASSPQRKPKAAGRVGSGAVGSGSRDIDDVPARLGAGSGQHLRWRGGAAPEGWTPEREKAAARALRDYSGASYVTNFYLRGTLEEEPPPQIVTNIGALDDLMEASRLDTDVVAWRGLRASPEIFGEDDRRDLTGVEWVDPGFGSTSTNSDVSDQYATEGAGGTLLRILVPSGTGVAQVQDKGTALQPRKAEMLLQRGMRYRVVRDHGTDIGIRLLDVIAIPPDETPSLPDGPVDVTPGALSPRQGEHGRRLEQRSRELPTVASAIGQLERAQSNADARAALEGLSTRDLRLRVAGPTGANILGLGRDSAVDAIVKARRERAFSTGQQWRADENTGPSDVARTALERLAAATSREEAEAALKGLTVKQLREVSPTSVAISSGKPNMIDNIIGLLGPAESRRFADVRSTADAPEPAPVKASVAKVAAATAAPAKAAARPGRAVTTAGAPAGMEARKVGPDSYDVYDASGRRLGSMRQEAFEDTVRGDDNLGRHIRRKQWQFTPAGGGPEETIRTAKLGDAMSDLAFSRRGATPEPPPFADAPGAVDAPGATRSTRSTDRPAATPVPIHALMDADDATIEATLRDVYEGEFGPYTTKVQVGVRRAGTRTDSRGRKHKIEPSISVEGKVYDADGHEIGNFSRSIGPTDLHYNDGRVVREVWAEHHIVQLGNEDEDGGKYQGKGFGGAFNRRAIEWYRASGVHGISQTDHNFYVWASQGFDFSGGRVPDHTVEAMRDLVEALRTGRTKNRFGETIPKQLREAPDVDAQVAAAEALLTRLETTSIGQPGYPTAYEISQLGRRPGQRGKTARWFGKQIPVSADQMILNPDEGVTVTEAVRAQPDPIVVKRQNDLFDLWHDFAERHADDPGYDPDDDPQFHAQARRVMGLEPPPASESVRRILLARTVEAAGEGHDDQRLHHYWTRDPEGLAKWVKSTKPYTALVRHLKHHVEPWRAKRFANRWFFEVFGFYPGSDLNRVTHGKAPRGKRVGPG